MGSDGAYETASVRAMPIARASGGRVAGASSLMNGTRRAVSDLTTASIRELLIPHNAI
jgi:hypothetical protein